MPTPHPSAFSHWRRLSFVSALLANKYKPAFSSTYSPQSNAYSPKKVLCATLRNPTFPPLRVILSGGRQPGVEPGGRPQVGISNRRAHQPQHPTSTPRVILSGGRQPGVEPGGRPQVGISNRRAHQPRHPISASRVILSGGRSPESNPEGDRRSGSPIAERTNPSTPLSRLSVSS